MSTTERLRVGVCTLLVESQPDYLVITVTANQNLDRGLYSVRPDPRLKFTDPEEALQAVAEFLRLFAQDSSR